ncbi:hypothetical protein [Spiroplasma tabanidicola]
MLILLGSFGLISSTSSIIYACKDTNFNFGPNFQNLRIAA